MPILFWIIAATLFDSVVALVGVFSLWIKDRILKDLLFALVAFSAGALLSGALLHLMAESIESKVLSVNTVFVLVLAGFSVFFMMEKFLYWRHCHNGVCEVHPYTYLILFGDAAHNFIDGLVIAASFIVDVKFGMITTLMIISHEVPQELGDFAVLVYGGLSRKRALLYNFISQLTCVTGGLIGYAASSASSTFSIYLLPLAAGGFIYISASDLIPELHREADIKKSILAFFFFATGVVFMLGAKLVFEH
ncbi:MAG TPA: ZIP family metal transporter [Planctomycetota bacterium]|nr:ZIP family metal transporter [Planctomycetota bacterium]